MGGSRGRVQGCSAPEMTCGFVIRLVFCKICRYVRFVFSAAHNNVVVSFFVCFFLISWFVFFPNKTLFLDVMTVFELLNSVRETK